MENQDGIVFGEIIVFKLCLTLPSNGREDTLAIFLFHFLIYICIALIKQSLKKTMKIQKQHIRFASPVADGNYLWMVNLPLRYGRFVFGFKLFQCK